jgi:hypothetical protein
MIVTDRALKIPDDKAKEAGLRVDHVRIADKYGGTLIVTGLGRALEPRLGLELVDRLAEVYRRLSCER